MRGLVLSVGVVLSGCVAPPPPFVPSHAQPRLTCDIVDAYIPPWGDEIELALDCNGRKVTHVSPFTSP